MTMHVVILLALIAIALIYAVAIRELKSVRRWNIAAFAAGWTILAVSFASPLVD